MAVIASEVGASAFLATGTGLGHQDEPIVGNIAWHVMSPVEVAHTAFMHDAVCSSAWLSSVNQGSGL